MLKKKNLDSCNVSCISLLRGIYEMHSLICVHYFTHNLMHYFKHSFMHSYTHTLISLCTHTCSDRLMADIQDLPLAGRLILPPFLPPSLLSLKIVFRLCQLSTFLLRYTVFFRFLLAFHHSALTALIFPAFLANSSSNLHHTIPYLTPSLPSSTTSCA